jgi:hypothetical protein
MDAEKPPKKNLKQKVAHEFEELVILTAYLAFFFCALATYSMMLLNRFHISYFAHGTALLNALIIAKVILIGEALHAGTKFERKALVYSALWKAFIFAWLVLDSISSRRSSRARSTAKLWPPCHDIRFDELLVRTGLIFITFVPLFVFRELRRVIGDEGFQTIFFRPSSVPDAKLSRTQ